MEDTECQEKVSLKERQLTNPHQLIDTYRVRAEWLRANTIGRPSFWLSLAALTYFVIHTRSHDESGQALAFMALVLLAPGVPNID